MLRSATASAASTGPVVYSQSGIGQDMLAMVSYAFRSEEWGSVVSVRFCSKADLKDLVGQRPALGMYIDRNEDHFR